MLLMNVFSALALAKQACLFCDWLNAKAGNS
jgi:hypothetical protein